MNITRAIKKHELTRNWFIIDASGVRLGKIATKAAALLIGKHKVSKTTNLNNGDAVIIINSKKIDVHPSKIDRKMYYSHSGYMGGLREQSFATLLERHPNRIIEKAIRGMLPKNKLGDSLYKNLYVYEGTEHPHDGQKPTNLNLK